MTPDLKELRAMTEASLAERRSGSSARVRRLDFIHKVGDEATVLALLDAYDAVRQERDAAVMALDALNAGFLKQRAQLKDAEHIAGLHYDDVCKEFQALKASEHAVRQERDAAVAAHEADKARWCEGLGTVEACNDALTAERDTLKASLDAAVALLRDARGLLRGWSGMTIREVEAFLSQHQHPPGGGGAT